MKNWDILTRNKPLAMATAFGLWSGYCYPTIF